MKDLMLSYRPTLFTLQKLLKWPLCWTKVLLGSKVLLFCNKVFAVEDTDPD